MLFFYKFVYSTIKKFERNKYFFPKGKIIKNFLFIYFKQKQFTEVNLIFIYKLKFINTFLFPKNKVISSVITFVLKKTLPFITLVFKVTLLIFAIYEYILLKINSLTLLI